MIWAKEDKPNRAEEKAKVPVRRKIERDLTVELYDKIHGPTAGGRGKATGDSSQGGSSLQLTSKVLEEEMQA